MSQQQPTQPPQRQPMNPTTQQLSAARNWLLELQNQPLTTSNAANDLQTRNLLAMIHNGSSVPPLLSRTTNELLHQLLLQQLQAPVTVSPRDNLTPSLVAILGRLTAGRNIAATTATTNRVSVLQTLAGLNAANNAGTGTNWNEGVGLQAILAQAAGARESLQPARLPSLLQAAIGQSSRSTLDDARRANDLMHLMQLQQAVGTHPQQQCRTNLGIAAPASLLVDSHSHNSLTPNKRHFHGDPKNPAAAQDPSLPETTPPSSGSGTLTPIGGALTDIKPAAKQDTGPFASLLEVQPCNSLGVMNDQANLLSLIDSQPTNQGSYSAAVSAKILQSKRAAASTLFSLSNKNDKGKSFKKRRVAMKSQQKSSVPHYSERTRAPLGIDEDHNWLSEFQCFARVVMIEVFSASKAEVVVRSTSKSVKLHQVGVRCRFCAHLPHADRVNRSSAFPSSLDKIYQSFNMMVRDHFGECQEVPDDILNEYLALKGKNSQGACDSRHYWYYAAKKRGMKDSTNGNGIEMDAYTKDLAKEMPPYGTSIEDGKAAEEESSKEAPANEDLSLVGIPEVQPGSSPFLCELLQHLQIVRLLPSERVGKRKTLPIGLEGVGCRYCYEVRRLGFSRCYPLRRRGLSAQIYDMHNHLQRCTVCPKEVQEKLKQLCKAQPHPNPTNKNSTKKTACSKSSSCASVCSESQQDTELLELIWSRLGRTCDLTT